MLQVRMENRKTANLVSSLISSLDLRFAEFNILFFFFHFFYIPGLLELFQLLSSFAPPCISEMFPLSFGLFMPLFTFIPGKILLSFQNKLSVVSWP